MSDLNCEICGREGASYMIGGRMYCCMGGCTEYGKPDGRGGTVGMTMATSSPETFAALREMATKPKAGAPVWVRRGDEWKPGVCDRSDPSGIYAFLVGESPLGVPWAVSDDGWKPRLEGETAPGVMRVVFSDAIRDIAERLGFDMPPPTPVAIKLFTSGEKTWTCGVCDLAVLYTATTVCPRCDAHVGAIPFGAVDPVNPLHSPPAPAPYKCAADCTPAKPCMGMSADGFSWCPAVVEVAAGPPPGIASDIPDATKRRYAQPELRCASMWMCDMVRTR